MKRFVDYLWRARGTPAILLTLMALVFMFYLFPSAAKRSGSSHNRVTDIQTAFTKERFESALVSWSNSADNAVAVVKRENILKLDSVFPAIYGFGLAFWYASIASWRSRTRRDLVFLLAPLVGALFDYAENVSHLYLLAGVATRADVQAAIAVDSFNSGLVLLASIFATIKYVLITVGLIGVLDAVVRRMNAGTATSQIPAADFAGVLSAEFEYIRRRRFYDSPSVQVKHTLVGVALSGGGIRSATTCLGMLQTLSKLGILPLVDYMSTVSGGGYIGSCLSSLLTLDLDGQTIGRGRAPLFTTAWQRFPFNPQPGSLGAAQLRHLRTHGSFLVTRKGMLKRETLRSIGQLLSGTVYHLVLAALTLSSIALLYMMVLFYGSPALDGQLREVTRPLRTFSPAYEEKRESQQPPRYDGSSVTGLVAPDSKVTYTVPVKYEYPSLWERITDKAAKIKHLTDQIDRRQFWMSVVAAFLVGVAVATVAFWYLRRFRDIDSLMTPASPAWPGESAEEALSVRVLRVASYGSLAVIVLAISGFLWLVRPQAPLWLLLPIAAVLGVRVASWLLHIYMPRLRGTWTRDMRSLWGAYQATAVYALWLTAILAAIPVLVYALREHRAWTGISGLTALLVARALTFRNAIDAQKRPVSAGTVRWLLALAIGVGLLLTVVTICTYVVPGTPSDRMWRTTLFSLLGILACLVPLSLVGDANRLSPHYFYRDRLAEAYLYTEQLRPGTTSLDCLRDSLELLLSDLHAERAPAGQEGRTTAPLHLISAAINLAGSRDLTRKDRKSGYFLFSKYFCGSRHTGYRPTSEYAANDVKLGRAMTISGAAASSGIGKDTFFAQAFATVLFNLRLGYWMPNPITTASVRPSPLDTWHFWPKWLWREITMGTDERHSMVNVSDGGHTGDNVGIYPLLQRRCKLIIACDAECDRSLTFGSFTEALRHAYIDLGIDVDIDLTMIRPDKETGMSRSHCAVGLVRYPEDGSGTRPVGYLVYLKNSLTGDEPEPVLNYKSKNSAFPHESTSDQFFEDDQFESYRSLGVHIAEHAFAEWADTLSFERWRAHATPVARDVY